jgi:hypothetical protein
MSPVTLPILIPSLLSLSAPIAEVELFIERLQLEGEAVAGVGNLVRLDALALDPDGNWYAEWDTDVPDLSVDSVLLRNGALILREGQALSSPTGATLGAFDSIRPNGSGQVAYNFFLDGLPAGFDSGCYLDDQLLIQEGDPAPAGFGASATWAGFFETRLNDAGHYLVVGTVDDPSVGPTAQGAIARFDLDANGAIVGSTLVARSGDSTPFGATVTSIGGGPHEMAMNAFGSVIWAGDTDAAISNDRFVAIDAVPIAIEGSPSPATGRNWLSLSSPEVDLNAAGQWVVSGQLDGDSASNALIAVDGAVFRQKGDEPPGLSGVQITSFGSGPVLISERGEVLWYAQWNDPNPARDAGLFLDDRLLVREGDTIDGKVVDTVRGVSEGYTMNDDGSRILVEVVFEGFLDGLVSITRPGTTEALTACIPNVGAVSIPGQAPAIGTTSTIELDGSPFPTALATLYWSTAALDIGIGCGLFLPGIGELLIDPAGLVSIALPPWAGSATSVPVPWPDTLALVGLELYFQGLFVDATLSDPNPARVTEGLRVVIGV